MKKKRDDQKKAACRILRDILPFNGIVYFYRWIYRSVSGVLPEQVYEVYIHTPWWGIVNISYLVVDALFGEDTNPDGPYHHRLKIRRDEDYTESLATETDTFTLSSMLGQILYHDSMAFNFSSFGCLEEIQGEIYDHH